MHALGRAQASSQSFAIKCPSSLSICSFLPQPPHKSTTMAPAALEAQASENNKSVKVLEELLSKLTVSKAQDEINSAAASIATFINGDIEEADAPTKYVGTSQQIL